jgi:hypothetical protein
MKILLFAGLLVVVLGIASLIVPVPQTESHGIKAGDVNIGVQTSHSERVSPIVSMVLIAGGLRSRLPVRVPERREADEA